MLIVLMNWVIFGHRKFDDPKYENFEIDFSPLIVVIPKREISVGLPLKPLKSSLFE